ncbi:hypothetical protein [Phyllobacterium bourgognense]|uniref:Uncharacterized protein n=1 Tax=Phyllobacterium bourgognense TaxID=314236 RepID=A0A368YCR1_9HYPH|nr:hypothetical protein [Phyllobacterium bourgognense]RCW78033.1 hypothetical protein C7476_1311 [Phyllobacterium bourgognense]
MTKRREKSAAVEGLRQAAKHIKDYVAYGPYAAPANGQQSDDLLKRLECAEDEQRRESPIRR